MTTAISENFRLNCPCDCPCSLIASNFVHSDLAGIFGQWLLHFGLCWAPLVQRIKQQVSGGCLAVEFGFLDDLTIAVARKDAELIKPAFAALEYLEPAGV